MPPNIDSNSISVLSNNSSCCCCNKYDTINRSYNNRRHSHNENYNSGRRHSHHENYNSNRNHSHRRQNSCSSRRSLNIELSTTTTSVSPVSCRHRHGNCYYRYHDTSISPRHKHPHKCHHRKKEEGNNIKSNEQSDLNFINTCNNNNITNNIDQIVPSILVENCLKLDELNNDTTQQYYCVNTRKLTNSNNKCHHHKRYHYQKQRQPKLLATSPQPSTSYYGSLISLKSSTTSNHYRQSCSGSSLGSQIDRQISSSSSSLSIGNAGSIESLDHQTLDNEAKTSKELILTPSKITIEPMSGSSMSSEIPEYFNSPSRIKWNFLAGLDERQKLEDEDDDLHVVLAAPHHKISPEVKTVSIWRTDNDEANAIIFHHESEVVENCCNNYFHCNIEHNDCSTSDLCSMFSSEPENGNDSKNSTNNQKLNNEINPSPSNTTQTAITYFANVPSPDLRRYEKRTNLNQNIVNFAHVPSASSASFSSNLLAFLDKSSNKENKLLNINRNNNLNNNNNNNNSQIFNITNTSESSSPSIRNQTQSIPISTSTDGMAASGYQNVHQQQQHNHQNLNDKPFYLTTQNCFATSNTNLNNINNNYSNISYNNTNNNISFNNMINNNNSNQIERLHNMSLAFNLNGIFRVMRKSARKCADYIKNVKEFDKK